jgi:hypothetical protein
LKCITKRIDKDTIVKYKVESKVISSYSTPPEIIKTVYNKDASNIKIQK